MPYIAIMAANAATLNGLIPQRNVGNPMMEGKMNKRIATSKCEEIAGKLFGAGIAAYGFLVVAQVVLSYGLA